MTGRREIGRPGRGGRDRPLESSAGYSSLELLFALGLALTLSSIAVPQTLATLEDVRTFGAVRHVTGRLQRARMEAVSRSTNVALQFEDSERGCSYAVYADGNGNGVRSSDIRLGVDRQIVAPERLSDQFAGVDFGVLPELPAVDSSSSPPGTDPIKVGSSNILTFTASGTSSSGSLYILGHRRSQYAVRIFGETGKTRILKYDARTRKWKPL